MTDRPLLFTLLGSGESGLPWSERLPAILPCATTREQISRTDGVIVAGSLNRDELGHALVALADGRPMLVTDAVQLEPDQVSSLIRNARSSGALLRLAKLPGSREASFLRRVVSAQEPLEKPRAINVLRLAGDGALSRHVREELLAAVTLRTEVPVPVLAIANHHCLEEATGAFLTLRFSDGLVLRCTISLTSNLSARQVTVTMRDRMIPFPEQSFDSQNEAPAGELSAFCEAVRNADSSHSNGELWSDIVGLWATVDAAFAFPASPTWPDSEARMKQPPRLRVIEGGGRSTVRGRRPSLTLVAG